MLVIARDRFGRPANCSADATARFAVVIAPAPGSPAHDTPPALWNITAAMLCGHATDLQSTVDSLLEEGAGDDGAWSGIGVSGEIQSRWPPEPDFVWLLSIEEPGLYVVNVTFDGDCFLCNHQVYVRAGLAGA